ncbi:MAG: methyltransferase domain-containing protein [Candidatus Bathyarchaeota archaeon]|nr:methyltransferase domain-containing protein [Candidatus Bathyarchaeota archaeon]
MRKSSVKQIKERFDNDVERFSSLDVGQTTTVDAVLAMNLITQAAVLTTPQASHVLDVGCGAGNYTLKLLQRQPNIDITLVDLSKPMLERAIKRIEVVSSGEIIAKQGDIREIDLGINQFDIVLAAAVLHHLRDEEEWEAVFRKIHGALRPGGSFWVFDLVEDSLPSVQEIMWNRYGEYLVNFKDKAFRDLVYGYIIQEDTPRSLLFQVDLMRKVGFKDAVILHKNLCYAAFGAIKPSL